MRGELTFMTEADALYFPDQYQYQGYHISIY